MRPVIVITGTTASGKTMVAEGLCRYLGSCIISADSRCFYRGIDIGNGKFTMDRSLPYHLIDKVGPEGRFNLHDFIIEANGIIDRARSEGQVPIVCGGSMLHVQSLLSGMKASANPDPHIRKWLDETMDAFGPAEAHAMLMELDHLSARSIPPTDKRRLRRALETSLNAKPLPGSVPPLQGPVIGFFLDREDDDLRERIRHRTEHMLGSGWIEEVGRTILSFGRSAPGLEMTGVGPIIDYLDGKVRREDLCGRITEETLGLARSQRKWSRRVPLQRVFFSGNGPSPMVDHILDGLAQHDE